MQITKPTLFIHGYAGNFFSFGRMIRRFQKRKWGSGKCLILVTHSGRVLILGNPVSLIQVIFMENRDVVDHQVKWIWKILNILKQRYHITNVNLVAHSMGCISVLKYLSQYGYTTQNAKVDKVVTLGAPFNDKIVGKKTPYIEDHPLTKEGPIKKAPLYQWLKAHNMGLPLDIKFLNIAGNMQNGTDSDGQVSVNSARSLRYLVKDATKQYHEYIVHGKKAAHSKLHENEKVDLKIKNFLME